MRIVGILALVLILGVTSCKKGVKKEDKIVLGDTLRTESGLKYVYKKFGKGRKIEKGCEVKAYLSLKVNNKVVWNTNTLPDSAFVYTAGVTPLIKGFTEVTALLREGDEIVAILPHTIAYGEKGAGGLIPPKATLVYDEFKVLKVGEPKKDEVAKDTI